MNAMLPSFVSTLGWALIHFVWQGTLVGIATAVALMALRNARPQARYAVCCAALALCLALPVIGVLRGMPADKPVVGAMASDDTAKAAIATSATQSDDAFDRQAVAPLAAWRSAMQHQLPWIVALWSLGAGLLALRMALGMMWVDRIGRARTETHPRWQRRLDRLAEKMEIVCSVRLRVANDLASPLAAGCWKPIVLVPAALIANMPLDLLEALLAHELAHIKRHDYLVNLVQSAIESLLFYHPVVWWLSKQIRIEREQIADDLAVRAIGEPHRLALALHELDAFQQDQLQRLGEFPGAFHLVPAANGGHLMSRIQRLIRPNQHALSWKMALPLTCLSITGLTAVCLTVHAHDATPVIASATTSAVSTRAMPVAILATTTATVATSTPLAMAATTSGKTAIVHSSDRDRDAFALIRAGHDGMTMSGDTRDIPAIERTKQKVHGDFVWVRRGGKAYVVQDPAVIAKVVEAWQPAEALGKQMEALSAKMEMPSKQMEELGRQMETLSGENSPAHAAMEKTSAQMEALGRQQEALGKKMEALGNKMQHANEAERESLDRQMEALDAQMEPLSRQMDKLSAVMDEHGKEMEAAQKPMEDLGKQMEEASKPMDALGKQMDALGKQEDQLSQQADLKVKALIDEAMRNGKAVPSLE